MSKKYEAWELERYTPEELSLQNELFKLRQEKRELPESILNKLLKLDLVDLDYVVVFLSKKQIFQFLNVYRKTKEISINEYYKLMRFIIWNEFNYDDLYQHSKFRKKYRYPINLFYYLKKYLELSYRDLERISGIGKDTLNTYVKIYIEWKGKGKEYLSLKSQLTRFDLDRWKLQDKL